MSPDVNATATREEAARTSDVRRPIFSHGERALFDGELEIDEQTALDSAFLNAGAEWDRHTQDPEVLGIFMQFLRMLPRTPLLPRDPNGEDNNEFHWGRLRCFLGGAGFNHHRPMAEYLGLVYPGCPLDPEEDINVWTARLHAAHTTSGWPATLAVAPWRTLTGSLCHRDRDALPPYWCSVVALLHILKHVRLRPEVGKALVVYRHVAVVQEYAKASNVIGQNPIVRGALLRALDAPAGRAKGLTHPLTAACSAWLSEMTTADFVHQAAVSTVPGTILAGSFSGLRPAAQATGFVQHGMHLAGVWEADPVARRVRPTLGDDAAVMGIAWNVIPSAKDATARRNFASAIPETWPRATPFSWICHAFPNLCLTNMGNSPAFGCIFDAVLACAVMVADAPASAGLDREKPLIVILPQRATADESTKQGKSRLSHTIAQAMAPGITLTFAKNGTGGDAPDQRAMADLIRTQGTLSLDEWWPERNQAHPLSLRALASLTQGSSMAGGRVLENAGAPVTLRFPLVANAKTTAFTPDLVNRAVPLFLREFTPEEWSDKANLEIVESGRLAVLLRLAAVELVVDHDLLSVLDAAPIPDACVRWHRHMMVARRLAEVRGIDPDLLSVALKKSWKYMQAQAEEADRNGLRSTLESGNVIGIRITTAVDGLSDVQLESLAIFVKKYEESSRGTSPLNILKALTEVEGCSGASLNRLTEKWYGHRSTMGDLAMASRLATDLRARMPEIGSWWMLSGLHGAAGWYLQRGKDNNDSPRFSLRNGHKDGWPVNNEREAAAAAAALATGIASNPPDQQES